MIEGRPGKILGITSSKKDEGSVLYQVDLATGKVDFVREVPGKFGGSFRKGPDGAIWTFIDTDTKVPGSTLVRIQPADGQLAVVGKVDRGGQIAFLGQDLYLTGGTALRKIAGVAK